MNLFSRVLLFIAAIVLLILVVIRIEMPERVINQNTGFILSMGWAFILFWGVAEWKDLKIGSGSAGKAIVLISAILVGTATNYILDLGIATFSELNPILVFFFFIVAVAICFAWWKILWKGKR